MNIPLNIDIQQICLHLLNVAILIFGLYMLLYKPVKDFMEKREAYYRDLDEQANTKLAEAEQTRAACQERLDKVEEELDQHRREAVEELKALTARKKLEAEQQAEQILSHAQQEAKREREKILEEARSEVSEMAVAAVEKLMNQSVSGAYDAFLDAAERSDDHEQS